MSEDLSSDAPRRSRSPESGRGRESAQNAEFVDIVADVQEPPFDLIWTHILGVLIGQADGKVFVPEKAVLALDRFKLVIERDPVRYGWNVWLQPDHSDGADDVR